MFSIEDAAREPQDRERLNALVALYHSMDEREVALGAALDATIRDAEVLHRNEQSARRADAVAEMIGGGGC